MKRASLRSMFPPTSVLAGDVAIDLSARAKLRLSGADRVRFLNGQVSNDVRRASSSQSIYTCVMTIKGKMCADAFVHVAGESLLADTEPGQREILRARLERYIIADDVQLDDVTEDFRLFHLLATAGGDTPAFDDLPGDPTLAGQVLALRSTRYGRAGIDLFVPSALGSDFQEVLAEKFRFLDSDEAEALRVVAGVPRWGSELGEDTMPAEAGLEERAVSFDKGCYIGQEVVSRVKSLGHVNWHLRGLRATGATRLEVGMVLRATPDDSSRVIGRITSVAPSRASTFASMQTSREQFALGFVRRGWETPGTQLPIYFPEASGESEPATRIPSDTQAGSVEVYSLPFSR